MPGNQNRYCPNSCDEDLSSQDVLQDHVYGNRPGLRICSGHQNWSPVLSGERGKLCLYLGSLAVNHLKFRFLWHLDFLLDGTRLETPSASKRDL